MTSLSLETANLVSRVLDRIRQGEFRAALEQLDEVTAVAPDLREAWACKILVARQLGLDEVAQEASERLMALSPDRGHA